MVTKAKKTVAATTTTAAEVQVFYANSVDNVAPLYNSAPAPAHTTKPAAKQVVYKVVAPKRPLTGTTYGVSGNAFTHDALCKAASANGGTLTWEQVVKTCVDASHRGFASYALNKLRILQVAE